jgi:hypothetical protein
MSVTSSVEYLSFVYDYVNQTTYNFGTHGKCEVSIDEVVTYVNGTYQALDAPGGIDPMGIYPDSQAFRVMKVQYEHLYAPGETFTSVWDTLMLNIGQGNGMQLGIIASDGTTRLIDGKVTELDKKSAIQYQFSVVVPFTLTCPNPLFYSANKPGIQTLDSGLLLDAGWFLDNDPDRFTLTSGNQTHLVTNTTATAPDESPTVYLVGPISPNSTGYIIIATGRFLPNGNQEYVSYHGSVASGETVTIDCANFDVTSSLGVDAYSLFAWPTGQLTWLSVMPGTPVWTISSGGGSGSLIISWKPRFK